MERRDPSTNTSIFTLEPLPAKHQDFNAEAFKWKEGTNQAMINAGKKTYWAKY